MNERDNEIQSQHRYDIERVPFAVGGQGSIYMGRDTITGQTYVFKSYTKKKEEDNEALKKKLSMFDNFKSPFVMSYYGLITQDGVDYSIWEYCSGRSLRDQLLTNTENHKKLTRDMIIEIATCVLWGLYDLHKSGIIHNDICPSNIYISNKGTIKIGDLDSCLYKKDIEEDPFQMIDTQNRYKSPYILTHSRISDEKSDIWSLGMTLLTINRGENPFYVDDSTSMLKLIYDGTIYDTQKFIVKDQDICQLIFLFLNKDYILQLNSEQLLENPLVYERVQNIKEIFLEHDFLKLQYETLNNNTNREEKMNGNIMNYQNSFFGLAEELSYSRSMSYSLSRMERLPLYCNFSTLNSSINNLYSVPMSNSIAKEMSESATQSYPPVLRHPSYKWNYAIYQQGLKLRALLNYEYKESYSSLYIKSPLSFVTTYKEEYDAIEASDILITAELKDRFINLIKVNSIPKLIYKRSGFTYSPADYHNICDYIQQKMILLKCRDSNGNVVLFGGYRNDNWIPLNTFNQGVYGNIDTDSFVYILSHPSLKEPTIYRCKYTVNTLYTRSKGPIFGKDLNHIIIDISQHVNSLNSTMNSSDFNITSSMYHTSPTHTRSHSLSSILSSSSETLPSEKQSQEAPPLDSSVDLDALFEENDIDIPFISHKTTHLSPENSEPMPLPNPENLLNENHMNLSIPLESSMDSVSPSEESLFAAEIPMSPKEPAPVPPTKSMENKGYDVKGIFNSTTGYTIHNENSFYFNMVNNTDPYVLTLENIEVYSIEKKQEKQKIHLVDFFTKYYYKFVYYISVICIVLFVLYLSAHVTISYNDTNLSKYLSNVLDLLSSLFNESKDHHEL